MNVERKFFNGAERRAQLMRKGTVMHVNTLKGLGDSSDVASATDDWLSTLKNAVGIYQQNQVFNQQLKSGTAVAPVINSAGQVVAPNNMTRNLLLGGAAILAGVLVFSMMRRRR